MDATGDQPDEFTRAALEAVSEATELADREDRELEPPRRGWRRRLGRRVTERAERRKRIQRLGGVLSTAARRGAASAGRGAVSAGRGVSASSRWLSARVLAMAPRI